MLRTDLAGIDAGSEQQWVCAPALAGGGREVAVFGATTPELERLAAWPQARGVTSVALERRADRIAPHESSRPLDRTFLVDTRALARSSGGRVRRSGLSMAAAAA